MDGGGGGGGGERGRGVIKGIFNEVVGGRRGLLLCCKW